MTLFLGLITELVCPNRPAKAGSLKIDEKRRRMVELRTLEYGSWEPGIAGLQLQRNVDVDGHLSFPVSIA